MLSLVTKSEHIYPIPSPWLYYSLLQEKIELRIQKSRYIGINKQKEHIKTDTDRENKLPINI